MSHPPTPAIVLLLALLSTLPAASGPAEPPREVRAAWQVEPEIIPAAAARAEFAAVCDGLETSDEPYRGGRSLEDARSRMASARSPGEAVQARIVLGRRLLEQGSTQEAVQFLTDALTATRLPGGPRQLRARAAYTLALAHLGAGEDANCVAHHTPASCIFPISGDGVHSQPEHARLAGDLLLEVLPDVEVPPDQFRWLLNVARMISGDYPDGVPEADRLPASALESEEAFPRWTDRAGSLGVNVVDLAGGAIMDDFDGDGLLDLVSSTSNPCDHLKAFRNDGRGGFDDVTEEWGLEDQLGGLNLVHADYDGDGRLDLLVLRGAWLGTYGLLRNSLLRNEIGGPRGRFVDVSTSTGVARTAFPTQTAAWADYDSDGDLDLYVGSETSAKMPHPSELYRNDGDGTFTEIAAPAGVRNDRFTKGVTWGDYDDDGDPDLFVSNIGPNRLYRNNGDGTFIDVAEAAGVVEPRGRSFATWFFDYDNDGDLDLFVADYEADMTEIARSYFGVDVSRGGPLLYRNDGGRFTEVSPGVGIQRPTLPMGANYGDLDNDGWLDFYLGTGDPSFDTIIPNVMYRNREGREFVDVTWAGGFGHLQKGHGVAFGDLDNDGDQDLFQQVGGFYLGDAFSNVLFENPGTNHAWIVLRLEGRKANRFGLGARIEVRFREPAAREEDAPHRSRSVHLLAGSGGSFGGSSLQQEIGLAGAERIEEIVVRWPGSRTVQRFHDVEVNRFYRAIEGEVRLERLDPPRLSLAPGATAPGHR